MYIHSIKVNCHFCCAQAFVPGTESITRMRSAFSEGCVLFKCVFLHIFVGKNMQLGKMLTLILVPITALFAIILTQLTSTAMQMIDANKIRDSVQFSIEVKSVK